MNDRNKGRRRSIEDCATLIIAAYVSNNHVPRGDLPAVIASVQISLAGMASRMSPAAHEPDAAATASKIRKSIAADTLISFIDGKRYRSLKRHLTANGLDPKSYRDKYGLPIDYPMVAPSYSEQRSAIARNNHFGRRQQDRGLDGE